VTQLNIGNVLMSVEPQLVAREQGLASPTQSGDGKFTQMVEALLSDAVGPDGAGGPEPTLSEPDRALLLSRMLNLMGPGAAGQGDGAVFADSLTTGVGGATPLLEALAALRLLLAQSGTDESGDGLGAAIGDGAQAPGESDDRDGLLLPDGLLALAAAGWMTPTTSLNGGTGAMGSGRQTGQEPPSTTAAALASATGVVTSGQMTPATPTGAPTTGQLEQAFGPAIWLPTATTAATPADQAAAMPKDGARPTSPVVLVHGDAATESLFMVAHQVTASGTALPSATVQGVDAGPTLPSVPALQQIVQGVGMLVGKGETQIRLQLYPESLGQVLVQVTMGRGDISIHMLADTAAARAVIQDHLADLRTAFASQGLQVDGLSVAVGSDPSAFNASAQRRNDWSAEAGHPQANLAVQEEPAAAPVHSRPPVAHRACLVDYQV
jgi:hypothetical protein